MENSKTIYFPGLNGLRAIAALTVLWGHTFQSYFADWGVADVLHIPFFSEGVTLFFVISGFLITYLLLEEKRQTKNVKISKFYIRRILRIWPLYYIYIAICILVLCLMGSGESILNGNLWYYILLTANIPFALSAGLPLIVHLWSIGVEEQFYLFWPWITKHSRNILKSAIIICVLLIIVRYSTYCVSINKYGLGGGKLLIYRLLSVTQFQCMMIGSIGAVLYSRRNHLIMYFSNQNVQLILWVLLVTFPLFSKYMPSVVVAEFVAVLSLGLIIGQISSKSVINLENSVCDFIGKISYGIYVIHPLILLLFSRCWKSLKLQWQPTLQCVMIYIIVTVLTIAIAYVSYRYFESAILRYKTKFAVVNSRNSYKQYDRNRI